MSGTGDALGFNKIAFCVLATGLALIGLNIGSQSLFHVAHHEKAGYEIAVTETPGTTEATEPEGPRDYFRLISAANIDAGKQVAKKCEQCHSFVQNGEIVQGPPLFGVVGRDIASYPGMKYSNGAGSLAALDGNWDYERLDHFTQRPKAVAPSTLMTFAGLKKLDDRMNLIAYLRTLTTGEPVPLPPPLPEAPAAPAPAEGATPAPAEGAAPATPAPAAPANGATPAQPAPAPAAPAKPAPAAPH